MAQRFVTVLKKARFVYSPYTAQEMSGFAQVLADSIKARIQSGQNIYDQAAAPLSMKYKETWKDHHLESLGADRGYRSRKLKRGLQPIRDWTWTGFTLRCLKVLDASPNKARIGFLEDRLPGRQLTASQVAYVNNLRERQWGVSPRDRAAVVTVMVGGHRMVSVASLAA